MKLKFLAAFGALALVSAISAAPASAFTVDGLAKTTNSMVQTVAYHHCVVRTVVTHVHGHRVVKKVRTCH
jgi:hypothetical protein